MNPEKMVVDEYPTFEELMDNSREQTPNERLLVQAIAIISTREGYTHMTPDEVYRALVEQTQEVHAQV